jgi:hypothetical protein
MIPGVRVQTLGEVVEDAYMAPSTGRRRRGFHDARGQNDAP